MNCFFLLFNLLICLLSQFVELVATREAGWGDEYTSADNMVQFAVLVTKMVNLDWDLWRSLLNRARDDPNQAYQLYRKLLQPCFTRWLTVEEAVSMIRALSSVLNKVIRYYQPLTASQCCIARIAHFRITAFMRRRLCLFLLRLCFRLVQSSPDLKYVEDQMQRALAMLNTPYILACMEVYVYFYEHFQWPEWQWSVHPDTQHPTWAHWFKVCLPPTAAAVGLRIRCG